jgi:hypothetical protein
MFTNEAARQGVRTLLKFSSFDDGTPKGEYLKAYKQEKNQVKTNDLNADTILNVFKLA